MYNCFRIIIIIIIIIIIRESKMHKRQSHWSTHDGRVPTVRSERKRRNAEADTKSPSLTMAFHITSALWKNKDLNRDVLMHEMTNFKF